MGAFGRIRQLLLEIISCTAHFDLVLKSTELQKSAHKRRLAQQSHRLHYELQDCNKQVDG